VFNTYLEAASAQKLTGAIPGDPLSMDILVARAKQDLYFKSLNQDLPEISATTDYSVAGPHGNIPVRMNYPSQNTKLPCIIFIRGAGFWAGALDSHARTMRSLALLSSCVVCAVDYRRAPEFTYPVQRDEVLSVISWLKQEQESLGISANQLVIFGESAGATIALSVALTLRDREDSCLAGLTLFYCNAAGPKPTSRAYSQWVWEQYLGHKGSSNDANAVPLLDSMKGMPPAWIGVGEDDPLITDSKELYEKMTAHNHQITFKLFPNLPHAFVMFTGSLLPAYNALKEAALACSNFFKKH
jgi:acetyl esterase